jgi:threonine dehydrogenase-like Zn-dependent dehydrogenase
VERLPATMRAAVYRGKGRVAVEERELPELGPRDVLLRVSHCGVCGTDLHLVIDGWGRPGSIGGHEFAGRVAAVGPEVVAWAPGDPAVGGPEPGCGECEYCRAHRPSLCARLAAPGVTEFQGAFAEYVRVRDAQLLRPPPGLPLRVAALAEPLAVALHGLTLSGARPGERALVTGAGPIGLLTLAALRARGVDDVVVSEPAPLRRERASRLGARRVVEPRELEAPRLPFEIAPDACDVAFECSGRAAAFEAGLARLRKAGRLVVLGSGMERPRLDANRVLLNELCVTGAYTYDETGIAGALALLASEALPTGLLIEPEDVPLEGMLAAMQELAAGRIGGKVMVAPGARA